MTSIFRKHLAAPGRAAIATTAGSSVAAAALSVCLEENVAMWVRVGEKNACRYLLYL